MVVVEELFSDFCVVRKVFSMALVLQPSRRQKGKPFDWKF